MESKEIKENLDLRKQKIDLHARIDETRANKIRFEQEAYRRELELLDLEKRIDTPPVTNTFITPLDQLIGAAKAWFIDNNRTILGSEPAIRSLWDEDEIEEIKALIMDKMRKL